MALGQMQITSRGEIKDKVSLAIDRLRMFEPEEGYYVAFSGGKDSQCIYHLCQMAGVKFDAHFRLTSVDPPELIRFIKEHYPDVEIEIPHDKDGERVSMWSLIVKMKYPPHTDCPLLLRRAEGKQWKRARDGDRRPVG